MITILAAFFILLFPGAFLGGTVFIVGLFIASIPFMMLGIEAEAGILLGLLLLVGLWIWTVSKPNG